MKKKEAEKKTGLKYRKMVLDTILNGNDHNLLKKFSRYNNLFLKGISTIIAINIFVVLVCSIYQTNISIVALEIFSLLSIFVFIVEFLLRFFCAQATYPDSKNGRAELRYIFSFVGIIDILSIVPIIIPIVLAIENKSIQGDEMHIFMIFLFTLLVKSIRYFKAFHLIVKVFSSVKRELFVGLFIALIVVVFSGTLMYYVEKAAQPEKFTNLGDGFWWSVITYSTVGYGDLYPITPLGRMLAAIIVFFGIATIALPSGILSGAFLREMQFRRGLNDISQQSVIPPSGIDGYKFCPYCGKKSQFSADKMFCSSCGKHIVSAKDK